MVKKYIVELESGTHIFVLGPEGIVHIGEPDVVYGTVDGMQIGDAVINAEPYTEPDLEHVKKKAYDEGYQSGREDLNIVMSDVEQAKADAYLKGLNDGQGVILASTQNNAFNNGYKKCLKDMEQVRKEERDRGYEDGYHQGLSDAWEAARKILRADGFTCLKLFGDDDPTRVIKNFTASEAIEKIRQYEQEKDAEINIGNEVKAFEKKPFIVTGFGYGDDVEDVYCHGFVTENGISTSAKKNSCVRTGRHFPEIAEIFEKMRGEQDE